MHKMDQSFLGSVVLKRDLRVSNQKADRDRQHKLNMLDTQYKYTRKMLQQRRDSLIHEHRRMLMVKVCEPEATVNIAMKDIWEYKNTDTQSGGRQTSEGQKIYTSKVENLVEQGRSISAPPPPPPTSVKPASSVRHRGNVQSSMSFRQMKNIAAIDSISEKELARRQQRAREEMERLKQFQMETLNNRVAAFIEKLKEKHNAVPIHLEPP